MTEKQFNPELIRIGEQIRKFRKQKKYRQENLAEALDISVMTVSRIENGTTTMNVLLLMRLSKLLEVPVQEIIGEEMQVHPDDPCVR